MGTRASGASGLTVGLQVLADLGQPSYEVISSSHSKRSTRTITACLNGLLGQITSSQLCTWNVSFSVDTSSFIFESGIGTILRTTFGKCCLTNVRCPDRISNEEDWKPSYRAT